MTQEQENQLCCIIKTLPAKEREKIQKIMQSIDDVIALETERLAVLKKHRAGLLQYFASQASK